MAPEREPSSSSQNSPEPPNLLYIVFSALGVLWLFSKFRAPSQQSVNATGTQDNTNDERSRRQDVSPSPIRVVLESFPPSPAPPDEWEAEKKKKKRFKWYVFGLNFLTLIAVIGYACINWKMWREMQDQTKTARQQLELSERPWIKISFTIGVQGFSFQSGSATLPLQAHIQNIGHSVATGVIVPIKMFLAYDANGIFKEPLKRQKDLCDPIAEKPTGDPQLSDMALTIFPGDTDVSMNYGVGVGKDELDSAKTLIPHGGGFPKVGGGKRILPIIVGCVDYQYATSTHHHQTRFIYQVQRIDRSLPPNIYPIISIEVPKTVAPADVVLQKYGFGGFLAN
ncbi:MAG TPA: hypothetical protein VHF01_12480 [Candidatus Acidoferrum sp.]|nr:hypothetical protein [Candidatus Acidoferrum sp.]